MVYAGTWVAPRRGRRPVVRYTLMLTTLFACPMLFGCGADDEVCRRAADKVTQCTGSASTLDLDSCSGEARAGAEDILNKDCSALTADGKSDNLGGGFWCTPGLRWMGRCQTPLGDVNPISTLDEVCKN